MHQKCLHAYACVHVLLNSGKLLAMWLANITRRFSVTTENKHSKNSRSHILLIFYSQLLSGVASYVANGYGECQAAK